MPPNAKARRHFLNLSVFLIKVGALRKFTEPDANGICYDNSEWPHDEEAFDKWAEKNKKTNFMWKLGEIFFNEIKAPPNKWEKKLFSKLGLI